LKKVVAYIFTIVFLRAQNRKIENESPTLNKNDCLLGHCVGAAIVANNYTMPHPFLEIYNLFIKTLALLLY
jgi:hypothetical protein